MPHPCPLQSTPSWRGMCPRPDSRAVAEMTPTCPGHHCQDVGSYEGPGLQDEGPTEECVSPVGLWTVGHRPLRQGHLQYWNALPWKARGVRPLRGSVPLPPPPRPHKTRSSAQNCFISAWSHVTLLTLCEEIRAPKLQRGTRRLREGKGTDTGRVCAGQSPGTLSWGSQKVCVCTHAHGCGRRLGEDFLFPWHYFLTSCIIFYNSNQ